MVADDAEERLDNRRCDIRGEYEPGDRSIGISVVHHQKRKRCRKCALVDIGANVPGHAKVVDEFVFFSSCNHRHAFMFDELGCAGRGMATLGLINPGANAIVHAEFIADGLAFRFILVRNGGIDGRHDHAWHVFTNFAREIEHALECGVAEFAANEFVVFVSVGRIQRNGNRVDDAFELRRDITAVDEAALAVGVYTNWHIVAAFHLGCDLFEGFECACWLAESAENDFTVGAHILFIESRHDFLEGRLMFKPQHVVGAFAAFADACCSLAYAERARAAAAIREVDVEPVVDGVDDGFGFLHSELLST